MTNENKIPIDGDFVLYHTLLELNNAPEGRAISI
jgi:hypothetical protein